MGGCEEVYERRVSGVCEEAHERRYMRGGITERGVGKGACEEV